MLRRALPILHAVSALAQTPRPEVAIRIATPMPPPSWAALERELLRYNSIACDRFAAEYLDSRGYLADDAIETFWNWPLPHAPGGADSELASYRLAQEGHWKPTFAMRWDRGWYPAT